MNLVALIGNVSTSPECVYTPSGKAVCTFRIAVSRENGEDADFFTVATFERQAEVCKEYLSVGRRVGIQGRMNHVVGEGGSRVEIVANRVEILSSRPQERISA